MSRTLHIVSAVLFLATLYIGRAADKNAAPLAVEAILEKNVKALGGRNAIRKIKNRVLSGSIEIPALGSGVPIRVFQMAPNKQLSIINIEGLGEIREVFNGEKGWTELPDSSLIPKSDRENANKKIEGDFYLDLNFSKLYPTLRLKGVETLGNRKVYAVEMSPKMGNADVFYFDTENGLIAGVTTTIEIQGNEVNSRVKFKDYQAVDGVKIPHTIQMLEPASMAFKLTIESVKHNVKMSSKLFEKTGEK